MKLLVCGYFVKLFVSIYLYYGVERGSLRVELLECVLVYVVLKCFIWEVYILFSYLMI